MRVINQVYMADNKQLCYVSVGAKIEVKKTVDGCFCVFLDGVEADSFETKQEADMEAKAYIINERLVILGYGEYSGRRFWQLPELIQAEILNIANK